VSRFVAWLPIVSAALMKQTSQPHNQAIRAILPILPIRDGWSAGRQLDLPRAP